MQDLPSSRPGGTPAPQATLAIEGFQGEQDRRDYLIFLLATFACFLSYSLLFPAAIVLRQSGLSTTDIGFTLSSSAIPILIATLGSGLLIARFGPLPIVIAGLAIMLAGHASLEQTRTHFPLAMLSTAIHGIGFGLLMPAQMVHVKNLLTGQKGLYYFGIFTGMLQLPNLVGPSFGEYLISARGPDQYFLITAIPVFVALCVVAGLAIRRSRSARHATHEASPSGIRYVHLLWNWRVMQPVAAIGLVGFMYGFVPSYMTTLLADKHVPFALFFTTFSVFYFGMRIFGFRYLKTFSARQVAIVGVILMTAAYAVLAINASSVVAVAMAGATFGVGYAVTYPILSLWVSDLFSQSERGKPVALFNAMFLFGIYVFPVVGGAIIAAANITATLILACAIGVCNIGLLAISQFQRR